MIFFRAARIGEWSRAHQSWLQSAEAPPNSAKSARGSRGHEPLQLARQVGDTAAEVSVALGQATLAKVTQ